MDELRQSLEAADELLAAAASAAATASAPTAGGGRRVGLFSTAPAPHVAATGPGRGSAATGWAPAARWGAPATAAPTHAAARTAAGSGAAGGTAQQARGGGHRAATNGAAAAPPARLVVADSEYADDVEENAVVWSARPAGGGGGGRKGSAWDGANNVAAHLLCHLTAGMRFDGPLNVDVNEITTTLVPFPGLNLLQSSITPLFALSDVAAASSPRRIAAMFTDAFTRGHQLLRGDPRGAVHLAAAMLLRGDVALSDVQPNVERVKKEIRLARWNPDGASSSGGLGKGGRGWTEGWGWVGQEVGIGEGWSPHPASPHLLISPYATPRAHCLSPFTPQE